MIQPRAVRVDASTICQLKCPACPSARGENTEAVGRGFLKHSDFSHLLDKNGFIRTVELASWGEALLNPELPLMLAYAHRKGVATQINEGANVNTASPDLLEALVKYRMRSIRCAVDGITRSSYERYRVGGDLRRVVANIQTINRLKQQYGVDEPHLIMQFIVFGHNEHEIPRAIVLSRMLKMELSLKLNWSPRFSPVRDRDFVRKYMSYANRREYLQAEGRHYLRSTCYQMWRFPQINWDGKLLGCTRNIWNAYAENVFQQGLIPSVNNEKMNYARAMIKGEAPEQESIPCVHCVIYKSMRQRGDWITEEEIERRSKH